MENDEDIPEPIKEEDYKGNISYRTTSRRHYFNNKRSYETRSIYKLNNR